jgi:hypothetical protein
MLEHHQCGVEELVIGEVVCREGPCCDLVLDGLSSFLIKFEIAVHVSLCQVRTFVSTYEASSESPTASGLHIPVIRLETIASRKYAYGFASSTPTHDSFLFLLVERKLASSR